MRGVALLFLALLVGSASAAEPVLTLEAVLKEADAAHPELDLARARQAAARAETDWAASQDDLRITLEGALRSGRNPNYNDHFHPDHMARLAARKPLLDAGRTEASLAAAREESAARDLQWLDAQALRRLALMARYFDVLLADMQYNTDTEFMASAYVAWDNAKDRLDLGLMAPWELSQLEARYQDSLARRNETRRKLRDARLKLGLALNRPGPVLEDLKDPPLAGNDLPLPELVRVLDASLERNPRLLAQQRLLAASRERMAGARAENRPSLDFEAEAAAWSRDSINRDDLRAGLNFVWTLWQGGRDDARLARERALLEERQAQYEKLRQELRQSVSDNWEEIQLLRGSERRGGEINAAWRDLALDKARAEYEMELKTNLGNSMAETQAARLRRRAVEYRLALALARLEALLGAPLETLNRKDKP